MTSAPRPRAGHPAHRRGHAVDLRRRRAGFRGVKEQRAGGDDAVRPAFPDAPDQPAPRLGVYRMHQQLIGVRRRHPWLHHARATPLHLTNTQLVYQAGTTGSDCLCPQPPGHRGGPACPWCHRRRGPPAPGQPPRRACAARRAGLGRPHRKAYEERLRHGIPPDDPVLFLDVTVADPSEFEARLQVTGEERHGYRTPALACGVGAASWGARPRLPPRRRRSPWVRFQVLFRSGSVITPMPDDRPQADHEGQQAGRAWTRPGNCRNPGGSMDYSRRVDELQQRVAATKAALQAAATESREQLRQRDVAGIVTTSKQDGRYRTVRASTSSQVKGRPPPRS